MYPKPGSEGTVVRLVAIVFLCSLLAACGNKPTSGLGNSSHYERNEGKERVIVFVHGIYGSGNDTWTCSQTKAAWPKMLLDDDTFKNSDVYVVDYPSPMRDNLMTIDQEVGNIVNRLQDAKVFDHHEVVILAHSLGGLIVQRLLLTHREYAQKVKFIYFFSTPEEGSQVARFADAVNADPLLKQMFPGDENTYIEGIETDWINGKFDIPRYCAFERQKTNGILVVDRLSATRSCNRNPIALEADHHTIVKPCDGTKDGSYIAFRNAYRENPVRRRQEIVKAFNDYKTVDCGRTTSALHSAATVPLDASIREAVIGPPRATLAAPDNIKDSDIKVVSYSGNTADIYYGFNGLDPGLGCRGGHATIHVEFPVEQYVVID